MICNELDITLHVPAYHNALRSSLCSRSRLTSSGERMWSQRAMSICDDCMLIGNYGIITSSMKLKGSYRSEELFICLRDCYLAVHLLLQLRNAGYAGYMDTQITIFERTLPLRWIHLILYEKKITHYYLSFPSIGSTASFAKLIAYRSMLPKWHW